MLAKGISEPTIVEVEPNVFQKTTVETKDLTPLKTELARLKSKGYKPEPEPSNEELIAFAKQEHPYYRQPTREMNIEWLETEISKWQ